MFTGIIEQTSSILDIKNGLYIVENNFDESLQHGQSIAHDGACITIIKFGEQRKETDKKRYSFFAMQETLDTTNFRFKKIGNSFNVERCMIYGQRVDGHLVSGHIDCTAQVIDSSKKPDGSRHFSIIIDEQWRHYVIPKGSIAINGISLTVAKIKENEGKGRNERMKEGRNEGMKEGERNIIITACLIPYTWEHTNLSKLEIGDLVNIEFDMMGKYIRNF